MNKSNMFNKINKFISDIFNVKTGAVAKVLSMAQENKRQAFHLIYGILILVCLRFFEKKQVLDVLFVLIILGLFLSDLSRRKHILFISDMLKLFDRKDDIKKFPGKGAIMITIGFFLSLFLFSFDIAKASIAILSFGDSVSTIFGLMHGKTRILKNCNKTVEGSIFGFVAASLGAMIYVPLIPAICSSFLGMLSEHFEIKYLDDNILIPIVSGLVLTLML